MQQETTDGWDDFDIDNPIDENKLNEENKETNLKVNKKDSTTVENIKSQDTGWDSFDDWGQDDLKTKIVKVFIYLLLC